MNALCYFIGGPLDLTKTVIPGDPGDRYYALGYPALTLDAVKDKVKRPSSVRYRYRHRTMVSVVPNREAVHVFVYDGAEENT